MDSLQRFLKQRREAEQHVAETTERMEKKKGMNNSDWDGRVEAVEELKKIGKAVEEEIARRAQK